MVVHFPAVTGYPLGITRNPRTIVHSELHIASFYSLAPSSSDLVHVGGVEDILKYREIEESVACWCECEAAEASVRVHTFELSETELRALWLL